MANSGNLPHRDKPSLEYLFATGRHAGRPTTENPDLVLLDLGLPGISGFEVLRSIRQRPETRRIPVVILTCSSRPGDVADGYELGANSFIRKPEGYDEFKALVGQLERYWGMTNMLPSI
jgi:two-component system response regulator